MFTDPTGMSKEGLEHDPPKKEKVRGEKILHFKQDGKDMSVHENDEGIIARTYRFGKAVKKWTEDKLTGGFYFYDENKTEGSGDQSLGRTWKFKNKEEKLNSVESSSAYQAASFAKVGEGIGSIKSGTAPINTVNNTLSGMSLGESLPESKMTVNVGHYQYENVTDRNGRMTTERIGTEKKDSTIMAKDFVKVRLKINRENANRFYRKESERSHFKPN